MSSSAPSGRREARLECELARFDATSRLVDENHSSTVTDRPSIGMDTDGVVEVSEEEFDVFLSHTPEDEPAVEALARRLRADAELEPYLRRWMLIPGEPWVPALQRAIENSATIAVFFGRGGPAAWRDQESQLALIDQAGRRVIPVLLPGASKASIEGFLRLRTWVDLADRQGFELLIAGITGQAPELVNGFEPGPKLRRRLGASRRALGRRTWEPASPTPYRVFVSTTLCDDAERRRELLEIIARVGMLACPAEPLPDGIGAPMLATRRQELEQCDLFVMLVAWRYGSVPTGDERSIVELEYEWARERGIPRLVFLVDEERPVVVTRDFDETRARWTKQERLQALKARLVSEESTVRFTAENIGSILTHSLHQWRSNGAIAGERVQVAGTELGSDTRGVAPEPPTTPPVVVDREPKPIADPPVPTTEGSEPKPRRRRPRKPRARRVSLPELSRYLETLEHDNATTPVVGTATSLASPLDPEDLRVEVRLVQRPAGDDGPERDEPEPELELHRVFEHAERSGCRMVVLVGPPGSGKSTHLRRIALWLARRSARTLGLPIDTVPVLLSLDDLPADTDGFHEAVAACLKRDGRLDAALVEALLQREHVLFLVDGFDELPNQEQRARATQWLARGFHDHPGARFMITQRPLELDSGQSWPGPALEVQLPPLGEPEAHALVERWFHASAPETGPDQAEARRLAGGLWAELKTPELRTTRMFELTRNPLMLSVLCAVYRQRGSLPTRRVELYEQCLQELVRQWCSKGTLPRRFGDREARQVLQALAYWLHGERGRTHADGRSIGAMLEPHLVASLGHEPIDPEAFLRAVATDDGILTTKGGEIYGLLHLCFQEYLCARHLRSLSHGNPGVLDELADHFGDPWWREVTILLLALGEPSLFEPLMQRAVQRPAFAESLDLVIDCFHEAAGASVEPFEALLRGPPTNEPELWPRQLVAAQVLEKVDPERLVALAPLLREHPYAPLRRMVGHDDRSEPATRVSARSGYALVEIPAGRFAMGSHHRERGRRGGEGPRHEVELAGFFMGKVPVTNEEYGYYLRANPQVPVPAYWADSRYNHPRQPVVGVSWHEAKAYCDWAGLSLPTEAQCERACRGDTRTAYWSGKEEADLARVGWYAGNSEQRLHVVGERDPNPFGLHDVHGNVWEWCLDEFGDYEGSAPRPGDGLRHEPLAEGNRVIRGGSWIDPARKARAASRLNRHPDDRLAYLGFRAVERLEPDEG